MDKEKIESIVAEVEEEYGMPGPSKIYRVWTAQERQRRFSIKSINQASNLASLIDHTGLKPDLVEKDIERLCFQAREYGFASVCVNPCWVQFASEKLDSYDPMVCTVIGFPLGANTTDVKASEAIRAAGDGALEFDMVINIGAVKSADWQCVHADIASVVDSVYPLPVKVILETCLLDDNEIVRSSAIAHSAGAAYVKTSTGFSTGGATVEAIKLMSQAVHRKLGVKASGGIGDFETAVKMFEAGATRIGASKSMTIIGKSES